MSKLTRDQKIEIYRKIKNGTTVSHLSKEYHVRQSSIQYLCRLIDRHGIEVLRKGKNRKYTKIESLGSTKEQATVREKTIVILELRYRYPLRILLKVEELSKLTYYYTVSKKCSIEVIDLEYQICIFSNEEIKNSVICIETEEGNIKVKDTESRFSEQIDGIYAYVLNITVLRETKEVEYYINLNVNDQTFLIDNLKNTLFKDMLMIFLWE